MSSTAHAHAARRWFLVLAPVLAGACCVLGATSDPAVGAQGRDLYEAYGAHPSPLQWKSFGYHFGYTLWLAAALVLAGMVRGRGGWLANIAWLLAILGISTIPGFILADFYDSSITQAASAEVGVQVEREMEGMWALIVMGVTGTLGFLFALPLAVIAAVRGGLLPLWSAGAVLLAFVVGLGIIGSSELGMAVLAVGLTGLSISMHLALRGDRRADAALTDPVIAPA